MKTEQRLQRQKRGKITSGTLKDLERVEIRGRRVRNREQKERNRQSERYKKEIKARTN